MRNFRLPSRNQRKLSRMHLKELSPAARLRLKWFDWHEAHGKNVSLTCRHFGIARATFYRWKARYKPYDLRTLEDRPSRPRRCRQREWTTAQVLAVQELRERYIGWGKDKLKVLLGRQGITLSTSTVGRILSYLKHSGKLREPVRRTQRRRRPWKRQYAIRKPKGYAVAAPGDLVQIDTMEVRPEPGIVLKQFTTVDMVSRWSVPTIASQATARNATHALEALIERSPFPVRAIQVDGGSEFMAEFESACQDRGIQLFALPPYSPKLNGHVERANRTFRDDFYDCSTCEPTIEGFTSDLRTAEDIYNTIRPHQALGYLTPREYLDAWHTTQEELSRTS